MRQTSMVVLMLLVLSAGSVGGQSKMEFSVAPFYGTYFGDTRFELAFEGGGSELVFPLDVSQAGLELGFRTLKNNHAFWTGTLRLSINMGDPGNKMTDKDWFDTDFGKFEWSSTKSSAEGSVASLDLEFTRLLTANAKTELALVVGVSYQRIQQRLVGLKGTQLDLSDTVNIVFFQIDDDLLAGTYEARYFRPQVGLMPRFKFGSVEMEIKGVVSPLLHVRDKDDHVRRFFQIRTDGKGFGWSSRLALVYRAKGRDGKGFFGRISGEYSKASVDTKGFREYYADAINDPNDPDDDIAAGARFAEEHKVTSTQGGVSLQVGFRF